METSTTKNTHAKTWIIFLVLAGIVLALLFTSTIHTSGNAIFEKSTLKIGVFAPLTGEASLYGEAMKKGLDLAVEDINSNGGVLGKKVELIYEDTHLDPKEAVSAMNKFIYVDQLPIVIAAEGSGATFAAVPLADQTKTLTMVSIASTPTLKDAGDYVFRVIPSDSYQGVEIARIANKLGKKSAAILYVNDAYGIGINDVFNEEFQGSSTNEAFNPQETDFKTHLTKIKSRNPDLLIIIARAEFPDILKQAKELGINAQILSSAELKEESLIKASGSAAEGVLIPFYAKTTDYADYKAKFIKKYGEEPSLFSDYGYDALMVIAKASKNAKTLDTEKIKNELYNITYYGATGIVKFDDNGEVVGKPFVIYQVKQGKLIESPI